MLTDMSDKFETKFHSF